MQKERKDIENQFKWNLEKMYPTTGDWDKEFDLIDQLSTEFEKFQGILTKSAGSLKSALDADGQIYQKLQSLYAFARMKRDEDNRVDLYQMMADRAQSLMSKVSARRSFFEPELIAAGKKKVLELFDQEKSLGMYSFMMEEIFRNEEHTLSEPEERLISKFQEVLSASDDIFTMINNADMDFGQTKDEKGNLVPLTHGSYGSFIESYDRNVRKEAYEGLYAAYKKQKNTIATTLSYSVKGDALAADIKKFDSSLDLALHSDNIPKSVYHNLIQVVNENLPVLQRYLKLRAKLLNLPVLKPYDLYVPLITLEDATVSYPKGVEIMKKALAPLGQDYLDTVNNGLKDGWIDVYENKGKTSGAYSYGSFESMPYILLNYQDRLRDVFTLVHEMGHSMHSSYSRKTQPFIYAGHSIFTAEVASTVNEALLIHHLLENAKDKQEKMYLINMHLEGFRTTLFRQTMFAEFELLTHEAVEANQVLTAEKLSEMYLGLNKKYFGDEVELDQDIAMEWARIPHFYSAFYVYKYATGYSAATAISQKIINEGEEAVNNYIEFLKSGRSNYPVELLKIAGVDMSQKEPIELAMAKFKSLVEQMESLVNQ